MVDDRKSISRIDALEKVTGKALFSGDFNMSGQLTMKILFAGFPHGIINAIDTLAAENVDGVVMILTAKDVPNNEYGLSSPDQPVLCGPGSNKEYGNHVRFVGDQIALVIAENEEAAEKARRLIKVDYTEIPAITSVDEARKDSSPLLHPDKESNVFCHYKIRKGEVNIFPPANNDVVVESTYHTPAQEHAFLQPEAGICYLDEEERITVVVGGQWVHEDQEQIAHALNVPLEKIRVIYPAIGGAFGGREDMSVQIVLALAVMRLHEKGIDRPVKIIWSREESMVGHHKRHPYIIKTKWSANHAGKLTGAIVEILADGGAYMYTSTKVLGNATLLCTGPYNIPNVSVDSYAVYTNNVPNGAFRGFGGPQAAFAAEMQMNKLAEKLNIDAVEFRMRNLVKEGETISVQTPLPPGISIHDVVTQCASKSGWVKGREGSWQKPKMLEDIEGKAKGIGFACGFKNIGFSFGAPEKCFATIELHGQAEIEQVVLRHAAAEVGQGVHTVLVEMAARALQVSPEIVTLIPSDTGETENSGSVSASRMTFMSGNSIIGAAKMAMEKWNSEERPAIATYKYVPPATSPFDPDTGECNPNFAYGYVAETVECEVDLETGHVDLLKIVCTDDVGEAINPNLVEGQIEGAIVQAVGYAMTENFIQKDGRVFSDKLSTYLIPTAVDIPNVVVSDVMEIPDHIGPWGARGVGEMPFLPLSAAIADAIHAATGVWIDEFPYTDERVYFGLKKQQP